MVYISGQMAKYTRANGLTTNNTAKDSLQIKKDTVVRASGKKVRDQNGLVGLSRNQIKKES